MTISEQIREAALYQRDPVMEMSDRAFKKVWESSNVWVGRWRSIEGRTFLLIVAEALE